MATPQLIADLMRTLLLLAPSAAVLCLLLAGLSLRQGSIPEALVGGNLAKWTFWAVVFLTLPQLVAWFRLDRVLWLIECYKGRYYTLSGEGRHFQSSEDHKRMAVECTLRRLS